MPVREKSSQKKQIRNGVSRAEEPLMQITSGDEADMLWSRKLPKETGPPLLSGLNSMDLWWIFPVIFCLIFPISAADPIVGTFVPNDPGINPVRFTHLQLHRNGKLYLGAVNRLYRLSANLDIEESVQTGPVNDNPACPVNSPCQLEKRPMSNHNRVLVIHYERNRLIACGNVSHGICTSRDLNNISNVLDNDGRNVPIVPVDTSVSVVAFIGPGVSPGNGPAKALYVGRALGAFADETSAIVSSRSLDPRNMFELSAIDPVFNTGTFATLDSRYRQSFRVNYVHGFSSGRFSYFVTTQPGSMIGSEASVTKIVRICQDDPSYYSYAEVALVCNSDGTNYNVAQAAHIGDVGTELEEDLKIKASDHVLFVSFLSSAGSSAVCLYTIAQINQKLTENIRQCFMGNGLAGLDFIRQTYPCVKSSVDINDDFCGMDFNYPFNATSPVVASPILTYPDVRITSLGTSVTHAYTVLFMGTDRGSLKKAVVEKRTVAKEYDQIEVDFGQPILADMGIPIVPAGHIYVATEQKVSKIAVQECSKYKTCGECLGASDPYCGWCSLENKCSLRAECSPNKEDSRYWIAYKNPKCTKITAVTPAQIQRSTARTLALTVEHLPILNAGQQLVCKFDFGRGPILETNATRVTEGVQCATPRVDFLPEFEDYEQALNARLSVQMLNTGSEFSATNVTFYDCAAFTDCGSCTNSSFQCDWCVNGHRCTHDSSANCRNDYLVNGISRVGYSARSGPNFCPRIVPDMGFGNKNYVSVPSGMSLGVTVKVENIQPFQSPLMCEFTVDGRRERTEATLIGDQIKCSPMKFEYVQLEPNASASFSVAWSGSGEKVLDNPRDLRVLMYKCAVMSTNCGFCLDLPAEFGCGWCQHSCEVLNHCSAPTRWLNRTSTCPGPQILRLYPSSGPWEGGTELSIEGINLGKTYEDIAHGITVVGRNCVADSSKYERTSKIVCETEMHDQLSSDRTVIGDVTVEVARQFSATSSAKFTYVDPTVTDFLPKMGPKSGGTHLIISGRHLNAGSSAVVFLKSGSVTATCTVIQRNISSIICSTPKVEALGRYSVQVKIDRALRDIEGAQFEYVADPDITVVSNDGLADSPVGPRGTPTGGSLVIAEGIQLNVVAEPQIVIRHNGQEFFGPCEVLSDVRIVCRSPPAKPLTGLFQHGRTVDRGVELDYGFKFDGVQSLLSLSQKSKHFGKFQLFPDPVLYNFSDPYGTKYHRSEFLFVEGENLNQAYRMEDYVVEIGMGRCEMYSLTRKQITCRPPETEPAARGFDGRARVGGVPEVRVALPGGQNFIVGLLSYEPLTAGFVMTTEIIIGISVGVGVLCIIVIGFMIAYRRKATESSRVLKTMQEQIDVLELQVASECKEAFAELQTDITDWTGDLTTYGIPFREYRWYIAKVLFPGNSDTHPVMTGELSVDPARRANIETGLKQFQQLLKDKTFLLTFIRTLESNRYFNMRDRVNVASLLMACLQSDMSYCTDILKALLRDLIDKAVDGKSQQNLKLLFRRNESVAEKMLSAWLTFLLYPFLKDVAGRPLYLLYRAVQMQIEKGPVDTMTSEAKYSLSEEKLIREKIDYKRLVIYVSSVDPEHASQDYQVKVLDCDSITQVKEKALDVIYRNTPYSRRPKPENLDLEWRTGQAGRCPLHDEDQTSERTSVGGGVAWRRLNTLRHYNVNDGAAFVLVPKHTNFYNLTIMSDKSDKSFHSHKSSPALSRGVSPFIHGDTEHGDKIKTWHLVKPHDTPDPPSRDGTTKRGNKMMTEIYLTRLLTTKTTLKKFIDDMFETILNTAHRNHAFPYAIKYLFDFLDDQALDHEITDPEVVHTWKSNSLPLRFWVNLIKNPNFVFDIHKSNSVDSCLSVIAQALMESCSLSDLKLSKDSPSSKLLFAKDIVGYQDLVKGYYDEIKYRVDEVSDSDLRQKLEAESKLHRHDFHTRPALLELFTYAKKHLDQLMASLNSDDCIEFAERGRLPQRLLQVVQLMNPEAR